MPSRHASIRLLILLMTFAGILAVFFWAVRPLYLNWGASPDEQTRALPGDTIVPDAVSGETRAITIRAPIDRVWPWLAQTGQDRGGFYSFDLLENSVGCRIPIADVLRPDRQVWQLGDKLWMYPADRAGGAGFATLRVFEPGRVLGFATRMVGTSLADAENGSWSFVAEPIDAQSTRVIMRGRGVARPLGWSAFDKLVFEPVHFVMERRMLIGLRDVVERGSRDRFANHLHVTLWGLAFGIFVAGGLFVLLRRKWVRPLGTFVAAAAVFQVLTLMQPPLAVGSALIAALALSLPRARRGPVPT